jgi:hypothetical protein
MTNTVSHLSSKRRFTCYCKARVKAQGEIDESRSMPNTLAVGRSSGVSNENEPEI